MLIIIIIFAKITSKLTDHRSQTNIILKLFQILRELPKCDTETQNRQMFVDKRHR